MGGTLMKEVYIVHYVDGTDVEVSETLKAAEQRGRSYLDDIKSQFDSEEFDQMMKEFEDSLEQYDGEFSVEDIMWVEIQPLIPEM
jgi:hypothetical protein